VEVEGSRSTTKKGALVTLDDGDNDEANGLVRNVI
jgi:hypothetical protein